MCCKNFQKFLLNEFVTSVLNGTAEVSISEDLI